MTLDLSATADATPVGGDVQREPDDPGIVPTWGVPRSVLKVEVGGRSQEPIDPGRLVSLPGERASEPKTRLIHKSGSERLLLRDATLGADPVVNVVHQVGDSTSLVTNVVDLPLGQPVEHTIGGTRVRLTRVVFDPRSGSGW